MVLFSESGAAKAAPFQNKSVLRGIFFYGLLVVVSVIPFDDAIELTPACEDRGTVVRASTRPDDHINCVFEHQDGQEFFDNNLSGSAGIFRAVHMQQVLPGYMIETKSSRIVRGGFEFDLFSLTARKCNRRADDRLSVAIHDDTLNMRNMKRTLECYLRIQL